MVQLVGHHFDPADYKHYRLHDLQTVDQMDRDETTRRELQLAHEFLYQHIIRIPNSHDIAASPVEHAPGELRHIK